MTDQLRRIETLVSEWWKEFEKKNQDYQTRNGNVSENFGLMGQYMKLTDKIHKLRRTMWEEEIAREAREMGLSDAKHEEASFNFESSEEILRDIIGHCFLSLDFFEQNRKGV